MKPVERRKYPYGIQVFSMIRRENYLYIDKTEYVYRMTHSDNKYMFLNRPRRRQVVAYRYLALLFRRP